MAFFGSSEEPSAGVHFNLKTGAPTPSIRFHNPNVMPKMGFNLSSQHNYLGHFKNMGIMRMGHNVTMKDTMHEFKQGTLHSGSKKGPIVKSRSQAIAIGLSQERKAGLR